MMAHRPLTIASIAWIVISSSWLCLLMVNGQCPWSRELVDLHTDCVCAYSNNQRLSIQCSPVNFTKLVVTLTSSVKNIPIDLLYVNNSTIEILRNNTFEDLYIQSLHLSKSKIREIQRGAFKGLETSLTSLNLQDNLIREIPVEALRELTSLQLLDLAHNLIMEAPDDAFKGLPLNTLKLSDNHINISEGAFNGLEGTLKNLNLQAAELQEIPKAIQRLKALAFLDLAQNKITEVEPEFLSEMQSLTALNLERNRILDLDERAFVGVNTTLSSLSLLNNLLAQYPTDAISVLTEIRVLDLGFNALKTLPHDAFKKNKYLTLLALDGNPLHTIPIEAFMHLNSTLRGLSLGGSLLKCDCRIRWIAEWVRDKDLQVTSRERNPQFCGNPEHLRRRSFFQLLPMDFVCDNEAISTLDPTAEAPTRGTYAPGSGPTKGPKRLPSDYAERAGSANSVKSELDLDKKLQIVTLDADKTTVGTIQESNAQVESSESPPRSGTSSVSRKEEMAGIRIKHAFKRDSTLVIEWDSRESPLGFQVLIRIFGNRDFKRIMPIPSDKNRVQVENLPLSQCLVVCVIEYEDASSIKVQNIPTKQCRELKGDENKIISLDKIIIGTSAIICVLVIIGALIIILFYIRHRDKDHRNLPSSPMPGSMPIIKTETDWETLSWNSGRSTPKTQRCLTNSNLTKSGSTSRSFVLSDGHLHIAPYPKLSNGFSKSYSTHDNESRLSYSHMSKISNGMVGPAVDLQRSKSLTRPAGYHPYTGGNFIKKKKHRPNGRLASASSAQSSTECESDWNGRSIWKDNDVDIYISQNHMVPGSRKYRKDYSIR